VKIAKLEEREIFKDSTIYYLREKDSTNQFIIQQKEGQINQYVKANTQLENDLNTKNKQFKWYKRGTIAFGATLILLLLSL